MYISASPKSFGIFKMKLDFQNIDWKFKSLGHYKNNHLAPGNLAKLVFLVQKFFGSTNSSDFG